MLLHDLLDGIDSEITGAPDTMVRRVSADSRQVQPEDLFVAVRGTVIDGHSKIADAVQRGATVVVGEGHVSDLDFNGEEPGITVTYVRVSDSRRAHAHMLRLSRKDIRTALAEMEFYGVTGTNGKTTVATVLADIFEGAGRNTGFIGTTGIRYAGRSIVATHTTPDVDRLYEIITDMYSAGVNTVVMEVSSHALDQQRIDGIPVSGAIFTNLTRDHLDYHETMEHYATAKELLFRSLAPDAIAVMNGDDEWMPYMKMHTSSQHVLSVGHAPEHAVGIANETVGIDGCSFDLSVLGQDTVRITTPLIGSFNIMNTALAASMALAASVDPRDVAKAVAASTGPLGRMQRISLGQGATAIVDYAHTPDALSNVLRTLSPLLKDSSSTLIVVFGCGGDRDRGKRPEMGAIAGEFADEVWVTSDNPRTEDPQGIVDEIVEGMAEGARESAHVELDRRTAIAAAITSAAESDIVLIAGKGHEEYQVVGMDRLPFSDVAVVREINRKQER